MHLLLLRHAKSSWDEPDLEDHDRPLAPRGEASADLMRDYLAAEEVRPALVLCSSAMRARQTLSRVLPALGSELEVRIERPLYTFDAGVLLARLHTISDGIDPVMLVGHNPAMEELAVMMAARGERLAQLTAKYPTGALAEVELPEGSWREVRAGTGTLTRFVIPRELG